MARAELLGKTYFIDDNRLNGIRSYILSIAHRPKPSDIYQPFEIKLFYTKKHKEVTESYYLRRKQIKHVQTTFCPKGLLKVCIQYLDSEEKRLKKEAMDAAIAKARKESYEKLRISEADYDAAYAKVVKAIPVIERMIGYTFKNKTLLAQAFVSKHIDHLNVPNSGALELVGDRILYSIVGYKLSKKFLVKLDDGNIISKSLPDFATKVTHDISNTTFANYITKMGLETYIIMFNVMGYTKIYANCFESIIGAIALDSNFSIRKILSAYNNMTETKAKLTLLSRIKRLIKEA